MQCIRKYFPELADIQARQFETFQRELEEWNSRVNVVSRKDIQHLAKRHVLHSLAIAKVVQFREDVAVMDLGTGGGFPGIPLAILFPRTRFTLVESVAKKAKVARAVSKAARLENVQIIRNRAERIEGPFDFIVTRATGSLADLDKWTRGKYKKESRHELSNGLLSLKGGDLAEELSPFGQRARLFPIRQYFQEEYFAEKVVIHLSFRD